MTSDARQQALVDALQVALPLVDHLRRMAAAAQEADRSLEQLRESLARAVASLPRPGQPG